MYIRDPIHKDIPLDKVQQIIIDAKPMQRLRNVKQLELTNLIFPGANHTRFEHSLGTMAVTKEILNQIGVKDEELIYVGLFHDIGHGPFSHLSDHIMKTYLNTTHEKLGEEIIKKSEIKDILVDNGLSVKKILTHFKDPNSIVSASMGSDRIDYLLRDSYYTGVEAGVIDYSRLKNKFVIFKNKLAIVRGGVPSAESFLIVRYFMHMNIYTHHAVIIAQKMLQQATINVIESGELDPKEFVSLDDSELIYLLLNSKSTGAVKLTKRVKERKLFKRAYFKDIDRQIKTKEIEDSIQKIGLDPDEYIVSFRHFKSSGDEVLVVDEDNRFLNTLSEVSPMVKTLDDLLSSTKRLVVGCDAKNIGRVEAAVKKVVG